MQRLFFFGICAMTIFACNSDKPRKTVKIDHFKIIGIEMKTTNNQSQSVKDLGILWDRFFSEEVSKKVPNKLSEDIYSLYTDYESDYRGSYTAMIGVKVSSLDDIPEGFVGREFKGGTYHKFITKELGPESVVDLWKEIWAKNDELNRNYTVDFEVHQTNKKIEVYIAVKE